MEVFGRGGWRGRVGGLAGREMYEVCGLPGGGWSICRRRRWVGRLNRWGMGRVPVRCVGVWRDKYGMRRKGGGV